MPRFVAKHGGSVRALKLYIASFHDKDTEQELGAQPPTRSYRMLRCLNRASCFEGLVSAKLGKHSFFNLADFALVSSKSQRFIERMWGT